MCLDFAPVQPTDLERMKDILNVLGETSRKPLPDKLPLCIMAEAYYNNKADIKHIQREIDRTLSDLKNQVRRLNDRMAKDKILEAKVNEDIVSIGSEEFERWYEAMTDRYYGSGFSKPAIKEND